MAAAAGEELNLLWSSLTCCSDPGRKRALEAVRANALLVPSDPSAATSSAAAYFGALRERVSASLSQQPPETASLAAAAGSAASILQAGVACLEGFLQANLCGPIVGSSSGGSSHHTPLWQQQQEQEQEAGKEEGGSSGTWGRPKEGADDRVGRDSLSADERWVIQQLQVDGEDVVGRVAALDLLLAGLICLAEPCGHSTTAAAPQQQQQHQHQQLASWPWWAMRAVMLQQHVLSGRCVTLQASLKQLVAATLAWAQQHAAAATATGDQQQQNGADSTTAEAAVKAQALLAAAHLEVAAIQQSLGAVEGAQQQLDAAAAALGVSVELTGALGVRTKHQVDPKAQMIAAIRPAGGDTVNASSDVAAAVGLHGVDVAALGFEEVGLTKELEGMIDDSAVYLAPRITEQQQQQPGAAGGAEQQELQQEQANGAPPPPVAGQQQQISPLLQALLLGYAAQIKKSGGKDELQQWQMAPFVEAVLQQTQTLYLLHATARLLKCRHEKERGRTRERALMQLEQLCSALRGAQPGVGARLPCAFGVRFPLWPLLQKELAEFYIAMGFVGAALKIFEGLEMWDQLIVCYRLLGKKQVAQELVLARLQADPSDAKLWCALGDITEGDQHYAKAWEVSGHRSSRAQRSLGRSALRLKEYGAAAAAYEAALALNPLYPDAWFSLGYCHLKLDQRSKALQAFSKVTQQEPDHGEAWTNLAALWLQEGGWREALHASQQAVKAKRDSWQTWDNYALAAAKAEAPAACVRALKEVLELTQGQYFPVQTTEVLLGQLEQQQQQLQGQGQQHGAGEGAAAGRDAAADDDDDNAAEDDAMDAPEQLLQMLALASRVGGGEADDKSTAAATAASAASAAAVLQRNHDQAMAQLGLLLKGVANSPACSPAVWGLLGRWYGLQGQHLSAQEAWLKQVRALQSSPYKSDQQAFAAMAEASRQLCTAYLATAAAANDGAGGGLRELSAARLHLRGLLKQCEAAFEEEPLYAQLAALLAEVQAAEDAALAAKKTAAAAAAGGRGA